LVSIDGCVRLLEAEGEALLGQWRRRLDEFYEKARELRHLKLLTSAQDLRHDPGKLTILIGGANLTGTTLMATLRKRYHIELEMALDSHAIAMTSPTTTDADMARLLDALTTLDKTCTSAPRQQSVALPPMPEQIIPAGEALRLPSRQRALADSIGQVSRTYLWAYPPGIPLITPGAKITPAVIAYIQTLTKRGVTVKNTFPAPDGYIEVVDKYGEIR